MRQIYLRNLTSGVTTLISADAKGNAGNGGSYHATISDDGRYVVFESDATNLGAQSSSRQVYLKDTSAGTVTLIGVGQNAHESLVRPAIDQGETALSDLGAKSGRCS